MSLGLRLYIDPILHSPCEEITDFTGLENLAAEMIDTMHESKGVGLAANQVGINKRICVLNIENKSKRMVLVNPKITYVSKKKVTLEEGCLSCPKVYIPVRRYKEVVVEGQLLSGEKAAFKFTDFDARIVQHEIDHLNGKIISDLLPNYARLR